MGRKKTLPRSEYKGKVKLVVYEHDGLRAINLDKVQAKEDVKALVKMYKDLSDAAMKWFWVETGITCELEQTDGGYKWLVTDTRDNSMNYRWLSNKSEKFCGYIVDRMNKYIEVMGELRDTQG